MALYLISYDLHKARNYDPLIAQLRKWGAIRPLLSVWLVSLNGSAKAVRETLQAHVDGDDSIVVVELKQGSDWSTFNAAAAAEWFRANMTP